MSSEDVRARRAERVREQKMKDMPKRFMKQGAVLGVILLAAAGVTAIVVLNERTPDPVHWHTGWEMYVWDDERQAYRHVDFISPAYDLSNTDAIATHLHVNGAPGSDDIVHLEAKPPFSISRFFDSIQVQMRDGYVRLDPLHGAAEYEDNATHRWHLFVQSPDGEWTERTSLFHRYKMQDGDRVLLTYGDLSAMRESGQLDVQKASVTKNIPGFENRPRGSDGDAAPPPGTGGGDGGGNGTTEAARPARRDA